MLKLIRHSTSAQFKESPYLFLYSFLYSFIVYFISNGIEIPFSTLLIPFTIILVVNYPNRITKGMFLCPTSYEQRKQFMRISILYKTFYLTVIYIIGMLLSYYMLNFSLFIILFGTLYYFMFALMLNLQTVGYVVPKLKNNYHVRRQLNQTYRSLKERFFNIVCIFFLTFGLLLYCDIERFTTTHVILSTIGLFFNAAFVTFYLIKYAPKVIELNVDYESIYTPTIPD